jgi:transcriptional regulator GlxA family with amidase domain
MEIAFVLYDGFTALDAVGPLEVLRRLPDARVACLAPEAGPCASDTPGFAVVAQPLDAIRAPDVIVVAGGSTTLRALDDERLLRWLREAHETSTWTTSVCTGALLLGAAGILRGRRATTHWYELESLRAFDAEPVAERVVTDGAVVTAAGVSAGIDMALRLTELIAGTDYAQGVQLAMEYDPQPPHDCGSLAKAPPAIAETVRAVLADGLGRPLGERVRER